MAAHRTLERTLPGLIEGLDQVVADAGGARQRRPFAEKPRLFDRSGPRRPAHAPGARPAGLAEKHLVAREGLLHPRQSRAHVLDRLGDTNRVILPERQDVDGDEVDRIGELCVLQPEFPHIRIGHRDRHRFLHRPDQAGQVGRSLFAPQQHLVTNHDRVNVRRMCLRDLDRPGNLALVLRRIPTDPDAKQDPHAQFPGDRRHRLQALADGIGPDAVGVRTEDLQVGTEALDRHPRIGIEGRLAGATKRRIGQAGHTRGRGIDQRHRH